MKRSVRNVRSFSKQRGRIYRCQEPRRGEQNWKAGRRGRMNGTMRKAWWRAARYFVVAQRHFFFFIFFIGFVVRASKRSVLEQVSVGIISIYWRAVRKKFLDTEIIIAAGTALSASIICNVASQTARKGV